MNGIACALTGRLGGDAELKYTANGSALATFSVAVDDAKRAEGVDTEWIRATVWGADAEQLAPRLVKGTAVYLEGRLRLEQWQTREGEHRATLKLSCWVCTPMGQIGRQAPKRRGPSGDPIALGAGHRVAGGRDMRRELALDDDGWSGGTSIGGREPDHAALGVSVLRDRD